MADRFRTADGWSVETVRLSMTPDHHDGEWIRVRRFGYWVADVRAVEDLARWLPLSALEPDGLKIHAGRGSGRGVGAWRPPGQPRPAVVQVVELVAWGRSGSCLPLRTGVPG